MMRALRENGRIAPVDSIGCSAAVVNATCEELLDWMEAGVVQGELAFPESNGPIQWSNGALVEALRPYVESIREDACSRKRSLQVSTSDSGY
jgi:hypothetical protein